MTRQLGCLALMVGLVVLLISQCVPTLRSATTGKHGVALFIEGNYPDYKPKVDRAVNEAIGLGADAIELVYPFFMTGPYDSAVVLSNAAHQAPSTADLTYAINLAHSHGMAVTLKPTLFEGPELSGLWRGAIAPANQGQWFDSYTVTVLQPATQLGADVIVLGTELNSLEGADYHWYQVLDHLPAGIYTYDQNWDSYKNAPDWFARLAFRSVDAYAPAATPNQVGMVVHPGDAVAEVGLARYAGAYRTPWALPVGTYQDGLAEQLAYFQAVCDAYVKPDTLRSVFFWTLNLDAGDGFTLNNTPAEEIIRGCYR